MSFAGPAFNWSIMRFLIVLLLLAGGTAEAQQPAPAPVAQQKVDQLIKLLDDPEVRALLATRAAAPAAMMPNMSASALTIWLNDVQAHLQAIRQAIPLIPTEFSRAAATTMAGIDDRGPLRVLLLFLLLVAIGLCAEFGFSHVVRRIHARRAAGHNPLQPGSGLRHDRQAHAPAGQLGHEP